MLTIKHKRSNAVANCNGKDICYVQLDATKYVEKSPKGQTIRFQRTGPQAGKGFKVTIVPKLGPQDSYATNSNSVDVTVSGAQADGEYKYTIEYGNDTDAWVTPLDPIIIIEPSFLKKLWKVLVGTLAGLVVGAWYAMNFM